MLTNCILFFYFLSLVLVYGIANTNLQYLCFFLMLFCFIFSILKSGFKIKFKFNNVIDYLPGMMFLVWFYGVIIGLLNGVDTNVVFRNFAGMVLYLTYYILKHFKVKVDSLINILFIAAIINSLYAISGLFTGLQVTRDSTDFVDLRFYYSTGVFVIFPGIAIVFSFIVSKRDEILQKYKLYGKRFKLISLFIFIFAILLTMSKGFFAGLFYQILALLFVIMTIALRKLKIKKGAFLLFISTTAVLMFITFSIFDIIVYNFSDEQSGNTIRNEQKDELVKDFTVLGHGLGASLSSGYSRDTLGYGFELSYFNVIHKVGVVSLIVFLVFIYTKLKVIKWLLEGKNIQLGIIIFGCMVYLIPSYGNPMLFSPSSVMLQVAAFYLMFEGVSFERKCINV